MRVDGPLDEARKAKLIIGKATNKPVAGGEEQGSGVSIHDSDQQDQRSRSTQQNARQELSWDFEALRMESDSRIRGTVHTSWSNRSSKSVGHPRDVCNSKAHDNEMRP